MVIWPINYEDRVRSKLGVDVETLPDKDIQDEAELAGALIDQMIPDFEKDEARKVFLESAAIIQICILLCPGMPNRVKVQEQDETLYAYKIQTVSWAAKKSEFEEMLKVYVSLASGIDGLVPPTPLEVISHDRPKI